MTDPVPSTDPHDAAASAAGDATESAAPTVNDPYPTREPQDIPSSENRIWPEIPGYRIECELGRGGMGVVYKALQLKLKRWVALKMINEEVFGDAELLRRFRREAEAVAQLQHPHIVQIYDIGEHEGRPYFSLEFVDGITLAQKLKKEKLPLREAVRLLEALACAVHHAHERGIIHRDLKPANVLVMASGMPKIADFGLARHIQGGGNTALGDVLGTPNYMSPEQAAGLIEKIGPAADIYSLGAILYEMLTGRPPFVGKTRGETILEVVHKLPAPPSKLNAQAPAVLESICLRCLKKNPSERFPSSEALAQELRRYLAVQDSRVTAPPEATPAAAKPPPPPRRASQLAPRPPSAPDVTLGKEAKASSPRAATAKGSGERLPAAAGTATAPPQRWVIGRAPDCDIVVQEEAVSGRHCCLTQTPQGLVLEDLGSRNGTYVNGQRLTAKVLVTQQDKVTLGQKVEMPWPALPAAPAKPSLPPPPQTIADPKAGSSPGRPALIRIGRAPDNDVVLDLPMISSRHARVERAGSQWFIEDLGSTNGTAIGHPGQRIKRAPLGPEDTIFFGSYRMPAARLLGGQGSAGEAPHLTVTVQDQPIVFGRDPSCQQVLTVPMVSWRHARLSRRGGQLTLEDLKSTNGTYVNGQRITGSVVVKPGDVIALGSYSFTLTAGGDLEKRDLRNNVTIEACDIVVEVPKRRLLDAVSLTIFPGEFVGLMGPSGAGKTTLMNVLNGYTPPKAGEVYLNGQSLYGNYAQFSTYLGYVPQDDIIHRDLTVYQALYYTARLRLPADFSESEIRNRIDQVLKQLGLEATRNVLIGSPEKKGISGGQRKRVNLAMELLTDPLVLFLDEPTSGLSSEDALMVMKLLRGLADQGKTILLTIHQPSLEAFRQMNNLILVGKDKGSADPGQLVYYGPAYPDAVNFFNPNGVPDLKPGADPSPDEVFRGYQPPDDDNKRLRLKTTEWAARYHQSPYYRDYVDSRAGKQPSGSRRIRKPKPHRAAEISQWWTLVRRCFTIKLKDTINTGILMAQAPIVALLVVAVNGVIDPGNNDPERWADASSAVNRATFLMCLAALWFGCSNAAREIVGEWAIYHRERMINLKIPSYVASKFAVLGVQCFIQCIVLLGIVHWGCGLKGSWLGMLIILYLASLVGVGLGLTISAVARTNEIAIAMLPIMLLPMVILGGGMQPIHKMPKATWPLCQIVPSRWAFEGLLVLESAQQPHLPKNLQDPTEPDMAEHAFPTKYVPKQKDAKKEKPKEEDHRMGPWISGLALFLLLAVTVGLVHGILRWRDVH
jgi:serine/threonine protein kinase/ABC-type multidrug transport system ATPase subunit